MKDLQRLYRKNLVGNFNEFDLFQTNRERISRIFKGEILPPYEVLIHPSSTCNLRCLWCIGENLSEQQKNERLEEKLRDPEHMIHILKTILDYKEGSFKTENISFSGLLGEPLVFKEATLTGMKYLQEHGIRTGLFTNGLLMDEEVCKVLSGISYVLISLDAATNRTYCKMKCQGLNQNFNYIKKVTDNIFTLNQVKKKMQSNLDINMGYVVNPYNYFEIEQAAGLAKALGVRFFRLKMDIAVKNVLSKEQQQAVTAQIANIKKYLEDDYFHLVEIHSISQMIDSDQKRLFSQCYINRIFAAVGSDGCLYACNYHAKKGGVQFGNLLEENMSDVWKRIGQLEIHQCPRVCDPYKNRANNMLNQAKYLYDTEGEAYLYDLVDHIL